MTRKRISGYKIYEYQGIYMRKEKKTKNGNNFRDINFNKDDQELHAFEKFLPPKKGEKKTQKSL